MNEYEESFQDVVDYSISPRIIHSLIEGMESDPDPEYVDEAINEFDGAVFFASSHRSTVAKKSRLTVSQAENLILEVQRFLADRIEIQAEGIAA